MDNRRQFFRVQLKGTPLEGKVSIRQVNGDTVQTGRSIILLEDISAGGLRFLSDLYFPVKKERSVVLGFETTIVSNELDLEGKVLWREQVAERVWEYGIQFDEEPTSERITLLNTFALAIHKGDLASSSICSDPHVLHWRALREHAAKNGQLTRSQPA